MISWTWPLLDIKWIPEILRSMRKTTILSWDIIEREFTAYSPNKIFSKYIFNQLKQFLLEFNIVHETNKHLHINFIDNNVSVKEYLNSFYNNCQDQWALSFKSLYYDCITIDFNKLSDYPEIDFSFITTSSVFKQWGSFFEFLDKAFLINSNHLYPLSCISEDHLNNPDFLDSLIKRKRDPRVVVETYSKHSKADKLIYTKGESKISISSDSVISPRIDPEILINALSFKEPEKFMSILDSCIQKYINDIRELYESLIMKDIQSYIYSIKILLDHFIYGNISIDCDYIDDQRKNRLIAIWNNELKLKFPKIFWKELPSVYSSVTHLLWNDIFFSNYLNRNISHLSFNEEILSHKYVNTKLFIRCKRSKVSLLKIMQVVYILISRLNQSDTEGKIQKIQKSSLELSDLEIYYLPKEKIDRKIILDKLSNHISIPDSEKLVLLKERSDNLYLTRNELLNKLSAVYNYYVIQKDIYYSILVNLRNKVDNYEKLLNVEIVNLQSIVNEKEQIFFQNYIGLIKDKLNADEKS